MRRIELYTIVSSNNEAINWCRERGLLLRSALCPVCRELMKEVSDKCQDGMIWQCRKTIAGTRHQTKQSIRHRSIFANKNVSIRDGVYLIYEWAANTSITQASYELNIAEKSVSEMNRAIRTCASHLVAERSRAPMGGEHSIVEVDEAQVGRRKHNRGRIPSEVWVVGGVERASNPLNCFIEIARRRNQEALTAVIQRRIDSRSRIVTDCWSGYNRLRTLGLQHDTVNHSQNFISPTDHAVHTQNVENLWKCLRKFLSTKGAYKRKNLSSYLDEFIFRKSAIDPFECILSVIAATLERDYVE